MQAWTTELLELVAKLASTQLAMKTRGIQSSFRAATVQTPGQNKTRVNGMQKWFRCSPVEVDPPNDLLTKKISFNSKSVASIGGKDGTWFWSNLKVLEILKKRISRGKSRRFSGIAEGLLPSICFDFQQPNPLGVRQPTNQLTHQPWYDNLWVDDNRWVCALKGRINGNILYGKPEEVFLGQLAAFSAAKGYER